MFTWTGSDDVTPVGNLGYNFWLEPLQADPPTFVAQTSAGYANVPNGTYTFHVAAKDGAGNGSPEATYTFTAAIVAGPPVAPTPATALAIAAGIVRVAWTDVANETSYSVERCRQLFGMGTSYTSVAASLPANTVLFDDPSTLAPRPATFQYRVTACDSSGALRGPLPRASSFNESRPGAGRLTPGAPGVADPRTPARELDNVASARTG